MLPSVPPSAARRRSAYSWLFNGTNLSERRKRFRLASNVLSFTPVTTNNAGSYQLVVTNITGSVTSGVAVLNVGFIARRFPPADQPDLFVRQQRRFQRHGQWFAAA